MVVLRSRRADLSVGRQYDDACMIVADANFIFCADHSFGFLTPDFRFFDDKFFIVVVEYGAESCHDYFLPGSYIRSAAYDRSETAVAQVDRGDV